MTSYCRQGHLYTHFRSNNKLFIILTTITITNIILTEILDCFPHLITFFFKNLAKKIRKGREGFQADLDGLTLNKGDLSGLIDRKPHSSSLKSLDISDRRRLQTSQLVRTESDAVSTGGPVDNPAFESDETIVMPTLSGSEPEGLVELDVAKERKLVHERQQCQRQVKQQQQQQQEHSHMTAEPSGSADEIQTFVQSQSVRNFKR